MHPDPQNSDILALLTTEQMYAADKAAIEGGVPGKVLMENAGRGAAEIIMARYAPCKTAILAGPGNNGGDGFVIARHLAEKGWPVTLWCLGEVAKLMGDAAEMAKLWQGETNKLSAKALEDAELVVDALFGAGLTRPMEGVAAELVEAAATKDVKIVAIDVPSGVEGTSGDVLGTAFKADLTITFFTKKPAHVLHPAKQYCGEVAVVDIGIPKSVLDEIKPTAFENNPELWQHDWPHLKPGTHKYARGHLVVLSGPKHQTGAARMAAEAGLRIGAGVVDMASPLEAVDINAAHLTAVMIKPYTDALALERLVSADRVSAVVLGPGMGVSSETRACARLVLESGKPCVLDADALTSFENMQDELFDAIKALPERDVVLTPHHGEFQKLFGAASVGEGGKIEAARKAAKTSGAIIVFKGPDTVITRPDGHTIVNTNAPPTLATAGAGDVLAGFISGLMAQGMAGFAAACAGVWLHGRTAQMFGPGLIAQDIAPTLPRVLAELDAQWAAQND